MPVKAKYSLKNVEGAVRRFKSDDFKAHVMPIFPEFKWSEVRDYVVKEKLPLNKNNVAKIVTKLFGQSNPEENDIKMRVCSLKLVEISTYPKSRMWAAFELLGGEGSSLVDIDSDQLEIALGRALRRAEIHAMRQITVHDGTYWIMVLPTKKAKLTRLLQIHAPSFFAYVPGCPFLFSTKKSGRSQSLHLEALKSALGYTEIKPLLLEGPDLKGLLQMLKCRSDQCADTEEHPMLLDPPELTSPDITVESGNVTVSERNARIEYAEKVFGTNPPVLKSMTIHAANLAPPNTVWGKEPIDVKLTFTGKNVFKSMKEMTASGVIQTPFPPYMHAALIKGKNLVVLKQTNAQQDNNA